jgi:hypothetical protein
MHDVSFDTIVRTLRMSSWCLGQQRLFWVLQEVSGHRIYGHETGNRSGQRFFNGVLGPLSTE